MKRLLAILLAALLAVLLYGVIEQHQQAKRQQREKAERALRDCWRDVAPNNEAGVALCKALAERLEKGDR